MEEEQYRALMDAISISKKEVEGKLTETLEKLRREVTEVQERTSKELATKLNKSSYQFRRKGNEVQFHFNATLNDSLGSAKKELEQLMPSSDGQKNALKRAVSHLDEGMKAIAKRQKHIKVADRSDYGWATVQAYDTDNLASGLDDEKRLEKAEKEAERQAAKKRKGASGNKRKASNWSDNPGPSSRREAPAGMMQPGKPSTGPVPQRPRVIGPCYRCAGWGHLAANCPKNKALYPLSQSVVGLADQLISLHNVCMSSGDTATIAGSSEVSGKSEGINNSACSPVEAGKGKVVKSGHQGNGLVGMATKGVDVAKTNDSNPEGFEVDPLSNEYCENGDLEYELGITSKYWELESKDTHQVLDVQGRLKQNLVFWKETLRAPPPILDCIEYGYRLPLKFLPPPHEQSNHRSAMEHCVFVNEAVNKLVANRCAIEVNKNHIYVASCWLLRIPQVN